MGKGNVPFRWEDMPGVSKAVLKAAADQKPQLPASKLPPPPCPQSFRITKISSFEMQDIPLPPCTFQPPPPPGPPQRTSSNKSAKKDDDPFLVAYRECTKSSRGANKSSSKHWTRLGLIRKLVFALSCKRSCSVRDGNLIRISHCDSTHGELLTEGAIVN